MIKNLLERINLVEGVKGLNEDAIRQVEMHLNVNLPNDFKEISQVVNYEYLGGMAFFNFESEDTYSVMRETLAYRKNASLPHRYLVLAEDDASVIFLETKNDPNQETPVIWCAIEDAYNICEEKPLEYDHKIFPSFKNFFEYLLNEEIKRQKLPLEE